MAVSKFYPTPLTPPRGSKVKYLHFAITKAIVKNFFWNFVCRQSSIFRAGIESLGLSLLGGLSGWGLVYVAYQINADDSGSNMVANIFPTDTPLTQGVGPKGQTISFSESSHVAYQIKADEAGNNVVANILPTDTFSTQGVGSRGQTISFSERSHVVYQIKGNWTQSTEHRDHESKYTVITHTKDPWGGVKRSFYFIF